MKRILFTIISLLAMHSVNAQQWVNRQYSYDSVLNVHYGSAVNFNGSIDSLKMDIYTPICANSNSTARKPLLIWIHGGAFIAGDKNEASITSLCKHFAERGYVTASINYRLGFVSDDTAYNCNYPNYSCVFATDKEEWQRAYFRAVQDAKGALRYLVNRNGSFKIDTNNIFIAGESAGAFAAMGVAFLDTVVEKLPSAYAMQAAPKPSNNTNSCIYNVGKTFGQNIARPDLGTIDGDIEPTNIQFTIKGVGNMYGGMMNDLLKSQKSNTIKPAIFSFHQPCDLVVPIDSGRIFQGLTWCMTNGYNCYGIANTPIVYGSRAISNWNTSNNYGYSIKDEFTATNFPFNFLFGPGSCADQLNNPCHAYDNTTLREQNLAKYFAPLVTAITCDSALAIGSFKTDSGYSIFPNPATSVLNIKSDRNDGYILQVLDLLGKPVISKAEIFSRQSQIDISNLAAGFYIVEIRESNKVASRIKLLKI